MCKGLFHEHNRPDRDDYLEVNLTNVLEVRRVEFEKWNGSNSALLIQTYDYRSIMHYGRDAFAIDKNINVLTPKKENLTLLNPYEQTDMTLLDITKAKALYGCN